MINKYDLDSREIRLLQSELEKRGKSNVLAWGIWGILGIFGGHKFYLKEIGGAVALLIMGLISFFGLLVGIIWVDIETTTYVGDTLITEDPEIFSVSFTVLLVSLLVYLGVALWALIDAITINKRVRAINDGVEAEIVQAIKANRKPVVAEVHEVEKEQPVTEESTPNLEKE